MITKNEIKLIRSLDRKKKRDEHALFLVEGEKAVLEALACGMQVEKVFLTETSRLAEQLEKQPVLCETVSKKEMEQVSGLQTPPGVLALVRQPKAMFSTEALATRKVLVLDAIRDPGNLGTIIRSADWFGINDLIVSIDTVDCFNQKVVQATMGSLFRSRIYYVDIPESLRAIKAVNQRFEVYAAVLDGKSPEALAQGQTAAALVIGNESTGVSDEVAACCDHRISIPRIGAAESLNASVAASVLMYAWCVSPRS